MGNCFRQKVVLLAVSTKRSYSPNALRLHVSVRQVHCSDCDATRRSDDRLHPSASRHIVTFPQGLCNIARMQYLLLQKPMGLLFNRRFQLDSVCLLDKIVPVLDRHAVNTCVAPYIHHLGSSLGTRSVRFVTKEGVLGVHWIGLVVPFDGCIFDFFVPGLHGHFHSSYWKCSYLPLTKSDPAPRSVHCDVPNKVFGIQSK